MDCDFLAEISEKSFNWCLGNARQCLETGNSNRALEWCSSAALLASGRGFFGLLASADMEDIIYRAAGVLPRPLFEKKAGNDGRRWLHVLSEAYEVFGHTKLCRLWIQNARAEDSHSVLLTSQDSPVPENLRTLIESRSGSIVRLDPSLPLLDRAEALREYAYEHADVVVLHIHMDDVIPAAAFSIRGGPPVVYTNHADHIFWAGRSIADVVFDIRDSGHAWTVNHRCVPRSQIVPIPLNRVHSGGGAPQQERVRAKTRLGIPDSSPVLLTIGSPHKYLPMGSLDFTVAAERLLQRNPDVFLIAVGPQRTGQWKRLALSTEGRFRPVGIQLEIEDYYMAADIYLEGFPCGSLTAMLDAGLAGLPCVTAPKQVAPTCSSDGIALEEIPRPIDLGDYVARVEALIADPVMRRQQGIALSHRISQHHCAGGWLQHLEHACAHIPPVHEVYADRRPNPVPIESRNYLLTVSNPPGNDEPYVSLLVELLSVVMQKGIPSSMLGDPFLKLVVEQCCARMTCAGARGGSADRLRSDITQRAISKAMTKLAARNILRRRRAEAIKCALQACQHNLRRLADRDIYRTLARSILSESAYGKIKRLVSLSW